MMFPIAMSSTKRRNPKTWVQSFRTARSKEILHLLNIFLTEICRFLDIAGCEEFSQLIQDRGAKVSCDLIE